jgi:hypothetical protein
MALHLRLLLVAVVVASAQGSGDSEASTAAGAVVVLGYRGPENGSEPLGLAAVGGDPPPLVHTPRFTYSKPPWLDDREALARFGPGARASGSWGVTDPIELPYTRSQSLEELVAYVPDYCSELVKN